MWIQGFDGLVEHDFNRAASGSEEVRSSDTEVHEMYEDLAWKKVSWCGRDITRLRRRVSVMGRNSAKGVTCQDCIQDKASNFDFLIELAVRDAEVRADG